MRFVIDEDLPRSVAPAIERLGYKAMDVRDHGLRGACDARVFAFAQSMKAVLVTGDRGFGNLLTYPPERHAGVLLVRLPNEATLTETIERVTAGIRIYETEVPSGLLVIVEPNRIRLRRSRASVA